ncbi:hypothetical protein ACQY0O_000260 [Thecaphora frezii]
MSSSRPCTTSDGDGAGWRCRIYVRATVRSRLLGSLTAASHISAVAVGSFLCVHLAPPLAVGVCNVLFPLTGRLGIEEAVETASRIMLLGRVYYQSTITEPILYASLGVHAIASLLKRFVILYTTSADIDTPPAPSPRPSLHAASGYLLLPLVGHHVLLNRLLPSLSRPAIHALSPSELDYSYVSFGLASFPYASTALYTALVVAIVAHATTGTAKIVARRRTRAPRSLGGAAWSAVGGTTALLLAGLAALAPQIASDGASWRVVGALERRMTECYRLAGFARHAVA